MRFFLRLLLIGIIGYLCGTYLSQWSLWPTMLGAFLIGLLFSRSRKKGRFGKKKPPAYAFWAGFWAIFLLWGGMALYLDIQNGSILSEKIADVFASSLQGANHFVASKSQTMIIMSALIGGLSGGFSAMTGNLLGEAIKS